MPVVMQFKSLLLLVTKRDLARSLNCSMSVSFVWFRGSYTSIVVKLYRSMAHTTHQRLGASSVTIVTVEFLIKSTNFLAIFTLCESSSSPSFQSSTYSSHQENGDALSFSYWDSQLFTYQKLVINVPASKFSTCPAIDNTKHIPICMCVSFLCCYVLMLLVFLFLLFLSLVCLFVVIKNNCLYPSLR